MLQAFAASTEEPSASLARMRPPPCRDHYTRHAMTASHNLTISRACGNSMPWPRLTLCACARVDSAVGGRRRRGVFVAFEVKPCRSGSSGSVVVVVKEVDITLILTIVVT